MSAVTLAGVTLLGLAAAVANRHGSHGRLAVGGWVAMALTTAALTIEELAEFKRWGPISVVEHAERLGLPWPLLVSPVVVLFVLTMCVFIGKALGAHPARTPLILGIACWVFALAHETIDPWLFAGRARAIAYVLEETLEFSGTLLIGLGAAMSLATGRALVLPPFHRSWRTSLTASVAIVVTLGAFALVFLFRPPLVEAQAPYTRAGVFGVSLRHQEALVQELRMPATPVHSIRLLLSNCVLGSPPGTIALRLATLDQPHRVRSQASMMVPAGDCPRGRDIELLPPLTVPENQPVALQVAADGQPGAELRVGATKGNCYPDGRLWINGALAWPDQNLEFVAYGAPEPTRSKFLAIWHLATTGWHWPLLAADALVALTLITFIPALLIRVGASRGPWSVTPPAAAAPPASDPM